MSLRSYLQFKNGNYGGRGPSPRLITSGDPRGPFGFIPFGSAGIQNWAFQIDSCSYVAADFTETKVNSGTILMAAGGLALVSGASSGNNTTAQMIRSILPATDKRFAFATRLNLGVVAKGKACWGMFNTATDPMTTPPTNGFFFSKDTAGTGALKTNFIGNSTVVTAVAAFTAVLATDYEFGGLYTPVDATNGYADFWYRAAGVQDWTSAGRMTAAAGNGLAAALRQSFNITATDGTALTMTSAWRAVAMEL